MSDIVTLDELKSYLGDAPADGSDDALLQALLDDVEAMFAAETFRTYTDSATGLTEVLDGTGTSRLYLSFPITAVTSIKLGYDSSAPDETLNPATKSVVVFGAGMRSITRTDGGRFGWVGQPRYVEVVYDHAGNIPLDAKLPIMEVAAAVYRARGNEGMRSETVGSFYSYTKDDVQASAATNVNWQRCVELHRPKVIA